MSAQSLKVKHYISKILPISLISPEAYVYIVKATSKLPRTCAHKINRSTVDAWGDSCDIGAYCTEQYQKAYKGAGSSWGLEKDMHFILCMLFAATAVTAVFLPNVAVVLLTSACISAIIMEASAL